MLSGSVTAEGTARYARRFPALQQAGHFHQPRHVPGASELWLSSIALGTYLGEPDDAADRAYTEAILQALRSGINVLDTAINYRHQRSERNLGAALGHLTGAGELQRDEILICTKAGYLAFDHDVPLDPATYFQQEYFQRGVMERSELAGGVHCMAPKYLADQIERSGRNLGLETLDVFYLHNPESQLGSVSEEIFWKRISAAFAALEAAVADGRIRFYGAATWNGFRLTPTQRGYMNLERMVHTAREVAGPDHHFRFVQLPFNLAMTEAWGLGNHSSNGRRGALLQVASDFGLAVMGSATLHQGNLTRGMPDPLRRRLGLASDAENAIQFARSATNLTSSLIGMGQTTHVLENLRVASHPPMLREDWEGMFRESDG
ncbi:MAG TPA: aldo/keto reductase [Terriglobales bacterium]|nr:aldo/keto reductase [Terriglobales bacterium]